MRYESKAALFTAIATEHSALCKQLDAIPVARWSVHGVWGDGWTVKDLVAHLAEWQAMFLSWHADGVKGIAPSMPAPGYKWSETPRLNRDIRAKHREDSAAIARAAFEDGYRRILETVKRLSQEELLLAGHFAWTGECPLSTYLGANSASHYRFGTRVLKRWQTRKGTGRVAKRRPNRGLQPAARR